MGQVSEELSEDTRKMATPGPQKLPGFKAGITDPGGAGEEGQEICHWGKTWDLSLAKVKLVGAPGTVL